MADNVSILEPSVAPTGLALSKSGAKDVGGVKYQRVVLTTDVSGAQTDVGGTNALPVSVEVLGAKNDALVTDPTASASPIAILKGLLSGVGSRADAATVDPAAANTTNSFVALLKGLLLGFGTKADAAVTDPAASGSLLGLIKGVLSAVGSKADAIPVSGFTVGDSWSLIQLVKTIARRAENPVLAPGENHIGSVTTHPFRIAADSFQRPADTLPYAVGDIIGTSTVAASLSVKSFEAARVNNGAGVITGAKFSKSTTGLTNAAFELHIFSVLPTFVNGDNGPFRPSSHQGYIGSIPVTMNVECGDGATGFGAPAQRAGIPFVCAAGSKLLYYVPTARAEYGGGSAETFNATFDLDRA